MTQELNEAACEEAFERWYQSCHEWPLLFKRYEYGSLMGDKYRSEEMELSWRAFAAADTSNKRLRDGLEAIRQYAQYNNLLEIVATCDIALESAIKGNGHGE